jgi:NDP-hexose-3-ketoreductase
MMANPMRVGVMGCASIAERMVIPAILQTPGLVLHSIASRNAEKAAQFASRFGAKPISSYQELADSPDIDLIYMPLPTGLHLEWAVKCLQAGKHVLLEKSLACNLAEAETIVDAARQKGLLVQENFMFAWHRQFSVLRDILASGRLGEIRCIRSSFGFPPFPDASNIRYSSELGGGALLDAGAYTVKAASLLLGEQVRIKACSLSVDAARAVDLHGGIFMTAPGGVVVETAFGFDHFYQCNLEVWGSKGKLSANRIFTAGPGVKPQISLEFQGNTENIEVEPDNHFANLLSAMVSKIRKGDFEPDYLEILLQASLLDDCRRMAEIDHLP